MLLAQLPKSHAENLLSRATFGALGSHESRAQDKGLHSSFIWEYEFRELDKGIEGNKIEKEEKPIQGYIIELTYAMDNWLIDPVVPSGKP